MQGLTLVFTDRKSQADYLEDFLIHNKFPATAIHGDLTQAEREFVSPLACPDKPAHHLLLT